MPISAATLNRVIDSTVKLIHKSGAEDFESFSVHDLRRTARTQLHEAGFSSDWIEKCLAHEQRGVRVVYGIGSLLPMLKLIGTFYLTSIVFVVVVFGIIARAVGFNILRFVSYIKEEMLIVLGTSSSEAALPQLMLKLEKLGCSRSVVGLVVPTSYSFNLDGTNIYMTMAVLFIAQATNTDLTWTQQLTLLVVTMLTSKGASGVTSAGFITLAATLAVVPTIPLSGMVLILGIDRFMSECRALTNIVGNGVATVFVSA
ncbi:MAG: Na+/H+-dicarboxylate symporter [uncultured Paraburkholderia sp.]|nr:MAG: Na+/H+-dicarboxylate symporter [uncultured Paraburkholderia sp.]CAH2929347.1 MAG: Na+/H+-dicarboxylate symporter [uncultured Paraburkholderia sp.]